MAFWASFWIMKCSKVDNGWLHTSVNILKITESPTWSADLGWFRIPEKASHFFLLFTFCKEEREEKVGSLPALVLVFNSAFIQTLYW